MQRTAENPHHLHTTEWEDIQYQFGNRVGKYETHEEEILQRKAANDPSAQNRHLKTYNIQKEKKEFFRTQRGDKCSENSEDTEVSSDEEEPRRGEEKCLDCKANSISSSENIADDDTEDAILEKIKMQRLKELKKSFSMMPSGGGTLRSIPGSDYIKEVTEDSARFWVVAILVQPGESNCEALLSAMRTVAQRQKLVKFVSMLYTQVVDASFPVHHLPCVLLYKDGRMQQQLSGPELWIVRREMDCAHIEKVLRHYGVLGQNEDDEEDN